MVEVFYNSPIVREMHAFFSKKLENFFLCKEELFFI